MNSTFVPGAAVVCLGDFRIGNCIIIDDESRAWRWHLGMVSQGETFSVIGDIGMVVSNPDLYREGMKKNVNDLVLYLVFPSGIGWSRKRYLKKVFVHEG